MISQSFGTYIHASQCFAGSVVDEYIGSTRFRPVMITVADTAQRADIGGGGARKKIGRPRTIDPDLAYLTLTAVSFFLRVFRQLSSDTDKRRNRPGYVHTTNIIII